MTQRISPTPSRPAPGRNSQSTGKAPGQKRAGTTWDRVVVAGMAWDRVVVAEMAWGRVAGMAWDRVVVAGSMCAAGWSGDVGEGGCCRGDVGEAGVGRVVVAGVGAEVGEGA